MPAVVTVNECALGAIDYFRMLSRDGRAAILPRCRGRRYRAGELVITRSDPRRDVFCVVSGRARIIHYAASGRETMFRELRSGDCFGELSAIDGSARSADVIAATELVTVVISRENFSAILADYPVVTAAVLRNLTRLVRDLSQRVVEFSNLPVGERVHAEIVRLAQQAGVAGNEATVLSPPTHSELAARTSTRREAVTRTIGRLRREGLIRCRRSAWTIPDFDTFRRASAVAHG